MNLNNYLLDMEEKWTSGSYNMFSLKISLDDKNDEFENRPTIIHEYTHYIQNMTTFHGFTKIDDYIRLFLFIFARLGANQTDPLLPLINDTYLQTALGELNLENMVKSKRLGMFPLVDGYCFEDANEDDYKIITENIINPYHNSDISLSFIIIDDKKIPLNEIVIRENMAMVNTMLSLINESTSMQTVYDNIIAYPHKEYSVIFDFLNNYLSGKDILQLTYKVCELSLNLLPAEKTILLILNFIKSNYNILLSHDEHHIIEKIMNHLNYREQLLKSYNATQAMIKERILMLEKIINTNKNDFVIIVKDFYKYIHQGLSLRINQKTFYANDLTTDYLNSLITIIGSPFIYYKNKKVVRKLNNVGIFFSNEFVFLHSALELFLNSYYQNLQCCPFYDTGVCDYVKNFNCKNNYTENFMTDNYETCLLNNCLLCTGIRSINRWEKDKINL